MNTVSFPQIVGPTYTLASLNAECQRCVNLIPERVESGEGPAKFYLRETPGLKQFMNVEDITFTAANIAFDSGLTAFSDNSDKPVQAMRTCANGRVFVAMCNRLFELYVDGSLVFRGNLLSSTSVTNAADYGFKMSENVNGLFIITRYKRAYTGNLTTFGLASLTFADNTFHSNTYARVGFLGGNFIGFMDQYLITPTISDTNPLVTTTQFQISPLNVAPTGGVWSAADVFSVESSPDLITGFIVNGREAWFFGRESYEVWIDTGDAVRPFQRIRDAAYEIGLIAPESVCALQGQVFWLGASKEGYGIVWMSQGYQAVRISNTAVERVIQEAEDVTDAISWSYQTSGHSVYVLSFPMAKMTWAYDIQTQLWHELSYRDPVTQEVMQHRGSCQIFAFNKNLVGDFEKGLIYELSTTTYTDNGAPIIRYRRAPVITKGQKLVFFKRLELVMETGVGLEDTVVTLVDANTHDYTEHWLAVDDNWTYDANQDFATYPGYLACSVVGSTSPVFAPDPDIFPVWPVAPTALYPIKIQHVIRCLTTTSANNISFSASAYAVDSSFSTDFFFVVLGWSNTNSDFFLEVYGTAGASSFDDLYSLSSTYVEDKTFTVEVAITPTSFTIEVDGVLKHSQTGGDFSSFGYTSADVQRTGAGDEGLLQTTRIWTDEPSVTEVIQSDPKISVRWSNNSAKTWGNYHTRSIGKIGEYNKRVVFNNQGSAYQRVYEVYYDDATPFRLLSAELGIEVGVQ